MGEEPERLRARLAEIRELLFTGFYDQEDDRREPWTDFGEAVGMGEWLLAEVERLGEVCEMHHRAEQGWADAQAEVERLAEERDDWKCEAELRGLPKELMQRLHRAEAECERLAGRVEVAEKNADISADDAERWEAKALRLARRVSALAALYVEPAGVYADLPGVDPWDEKRITKDEASRTPEAFRDALLAIGAFRLCGGCRVSRCPSRGSDD